MDLESTGQPDYVLPAWQLPLIVAAIAVAIVGGFYVGGPGLGMAVGALCASAILIMAIRHPPRPAIVPRAAADGRTRLLLVLGDPLDLAAVTAAVLAALTGAGEGAEVLLLAPLRHSFLDRWACDTERARKQAQGRLVATREALARVGIEAGSRIGAEGAVQAVEDAVGGYPATRVALVAAGGKRSEAEAAELRARLAVPFLHLGEADLGDLGGARPARSASSLKPGPRERPLSSHSFQLR